MKKEIHPGVLVAVIALVAIGIGAAFFISSSQSGQKVDLKSIDPRDLRDDEPIRRGQPGYRERITDPPTP
jgi:nitrogen fixation-related uncharacterized protein